MGEPVCIKCKLDPEEATCELYSKTKTRLCCFVSVWFLLQVQLKYKKHLH